MVIPLLEIPSTIKQTKEEETIQGIRNREDYLRKEEEKEKPSREWAFFKITEPGITWRIKRPISQSAAQTIQKIKT